MRGEEDRFSSKLLPQVRDHALFGRGIEGACRLIEKQEVRGLHDQACQGDALALSSGEIPPLLAHRGGIAVGKGHDEIMGLGQFCRLDDRRGGGIGITHGDIVHHGSLHEQGLLKDHADLAAQGVEFDLGEVESVDLHLPLHRFVEASDDLEEGTLARSAQTDHGDELAGRYLQGDMLQLQLSRCITEIEILAGHATLDPGHRNLIVGVLILAGAVRDIAEAVHRECGLLEVLPRLGESQQGAGHIAGEDTEGDQLAEGKLLIDHHVDADPENGDIVEPADQGAGCRGTGGGDRVPEGGGDRVPVPLEPLPSAARLDVLSLDGLDAGQRLDQMRLGGRVLLGTILELSPDDR